MGEVSYAPVIRDMVWSYSRIKAFEDCPYRWYLRYIRQLPGKDMFFANYGIFMHKLIEQHYSEGKTAGQMCDTYLHEFRKVVQGRAPNKKVFESYFRDRLAYLKSFRPLPYKALCVEKKMEFSTPPRRRKKHAGIPRIY
ncbi:MAG: PD-(D/E)XK nuclease family protein [Clostridia bacterium]